MPPLLTGRLGRRPAKVDPHPLRMARYLTAGLLADPPKRRDWLSPMTDIGMMLNDVEGDCTCAAAGHMIQAWTAANGDQVIVPDTAIQAAYSAVGGYVPGDPTTDNGAYALDVLKLWRDVGIGGHKILGWVALDPKNRRQMQIACDLFGGVYAGFELPRTAHGQEVWAVPSYGAVGQGMPGSWGGHMIPLLNYGPLGYVCLTWGAPLTLTEAFVETYCEEAYAVASIDWAQGGRAAPSGLLVDRMVADMQAVAALAA